MTLTKCYVLDDAVEVRDLILTVTSEDNSVSFAWDGTSPYDLFPGDQVQIDLVFYSQWTAELNYGLDVVPILEFESESETAYIWSECNLTPVFITNLYELYAIVFDGVDMESYYKDYYYPVEDSFLEEYK